MIIEVIRGDITQAGVDAIVNAANPALAPGGGVCGAIHRAAGPELAADCAQYWHGVHTGDAVITAGYKLPAKHVIHAVGPVYHGGTHGESILLRNAYWSSLHLAANLKTIAFPAISTGVYGYPIDEAARCAVLAIRTWDTMFDHKIETVYLVAFDQKTFDALKEAVES